MKAAGTMRLACALMLVLGALAGCNWGDSSHGSTDAANSVTLSWTRPTVDTSGNPIAGLAGYHVYYGTNQNALNQMVDVSSASITTCVVEGLKAGTWYFALKSYTASGVESAFTNIASKTID